MTLKKKTKGMDARALLRLIKEGLDVEHYVKTGEIEVKEVK